jgi:hypothetical protein
MEVVWEKRFNEYFCKTYGKHWKILPNLCLFGCAEENREIWTAVYDFLKHKTLLPYFKNKW